MMSTDELVFNGINGETGEYLLAPMTVARLGGIARGQKRLRGAELGELNAKARQRSLANFAVAEGVDPGDLAQAGWAVVFAAAGAREAARRQAAVREALSPLLAWRRDQATRQREILYREHEYKPGETKQKFLTRLGAAPGPVSPERVPYYLLLVGSPEEIPFHVQYQLDVQYAVGRIHFATLDEYETYARGVVAAEQGQVVRRRAAAFFGVSNPGDLATRMSHEHLVVPLADEMARDQAARGWAVERILGDQATAGRLRSVLGCEPPAFLFTASHGLGFPGAGEHQMEFQGALLCQDWRGPASGGIAREHFVAGEDITRDMDLRGLIGFHFACFGAGTPEKDEFAGNAGQAASLAPHAFVSRLPQRMLGQGGALAAVGHVDRAWGSSFLWADGEGGTRGHLSAFTSTVKGLIEGKRLGLAMEHFNLRYAELASDLTERMHDAASGGEELGDAELAAMWLQSNDARNYAVIGDPAVSLAASSDNARTAGVGQGAGPEIRTGTTDEEDTMSTKAAPKIQEPSHRDLEYGLFSRGEGDKEPGLLLQLAKRVTETLGSAITDAMVLEVKTYVSSDVGSAVGATGDLGASASAQLRAFTRCKLDGDTEVCVPLTGDKGEIDAALWSVHSEMVKQAQQHRSEMIKMVLDVVNGIIR
ncbi:MAG TPA: hypothetical protein VNM90_18210 [Haliangium sp.]|nr:hypothetical protein [Haliangium sp.]